MAYHSTAEAAHDAQPELLCLDEFLVELPDDDDVEQQAWLAVEMRPTPAAGPDSEIRRCATLSDSAQSQLIAERYMALELLSATAHERVLLGHHLELGVNVLLRCLSTQAMRKPAVVSRFEIATRRARVVQAELAERVLDYGRMDDGTLFRATTYPSGPSLTEFLAARGALPITEAIDLILSLCELVSAAHAASLEYRNLCPTSVFAARRADGSLGLTCVDFGALPLGLEPSQAPPACSHADWRASALAYVAPECLTASERADHRADIWSLGAIAYEMLSGQAAFPGAVTSSVAANIQFEEPEPLLELRKGLPAALAATVSACLNKQPWQRPQSVADLIALLTPFSSRGRRRASEPLGASTVSSTLLGHPAPHLAALLIIGSPRALEPVHSPQNRRAIVPLPEPSVPNTSTRPVPHGSAVRSSVHARTPTVYALTAPLLPDRAWLADARSSETLRDLRTEPRLGAAARLLLPNAETQAEAAPEAQVDNASTNPPPNPEAHGETARSPLGTTRGWFFVVALAAGIGAAALTALLLDAARGQDHAPRHDATDPTAAKSAT